jgi:hypothetical protein
VYPPRSSPTQFFEGKRIRVGNRKERTRWSTSVDVSVSGVVLDYELMSRLDGAATVAAKIKKVKPQVPIVMFADAVKLPDDALKSVDALVCTSDGPHFLWATVHFILNVKRA